MQTTAFPKYPKISADLGEEALDAAVLAVSGETKGLAAIGKRAELRHLFARNISQQQLAQIATLPGLETLDVYMFRGADLAPLAKLAGLRALALVAAQKVETLEPLAKLASLTTLSIGDMKRVDDFSPLARLAQLETLTIQGAVLGLQRCRTLEPISGMAGLRRLSLDGVRVDGDDLAPLGRMRGLVELRILPPRWPMREFARLSVMLPGTACDAFRAVMKGPRIMVWDHVAKESRVDPTSADVILVGKPMRMVLSTDPKNAALIARRSAEFAAWQAYYRSLDDPLADTRTTLPKAAAAKKAAACRRVRKGD